MNSNPSNAPVNEPSMSRQRFLRIAAGSVGVCYAAALGYPVYRYLSSPIEKASAMALITEVKLQDAAKLRPGTALMFRFGTRPSMLIHHADGTWNALEAVCSHLGCTVQYEPDKDRIFCACHGGTYNSHTGANIAGPPPKPLTSLVPTINGDDVVITRESKKAAV
jgi:cytochrome b6-f complex iron-sulfur subunit